ncbi:hypothetical protein PIB30_070045 [Stylosanthes scabra]|uniref:Uncharacterized protein n=1 Tax=Stylosanthes scabra TaxID=79078 RepID=A0ABU6UM67_9FABA|nr:hypothetical protein [Stylosanthes scabra]
MGQVCKITNVPFIKGLERGLGPKTHLIPYLFEEERKERDEMRVLGSGGGHYSPPTSGGHNFHTGAPIDALFAATRSSLPFLCFYPRFEVNAITTLVLSIYMNPRFIDLGFLGAMMCCRWWLMLVERWNNLSVQIELGIQGDKAFGVLWNPSKALEVFWRPQKCVFEVLESTLSVQSRLISTKNPFLRLFRLQNRFSHLRSRF